MFILLLICMKAVRWRLSTKKKKKIRERTGATYHKRMNNSNTGSRPKTTAIADERKTAKTKIVPVAET